MSGKEVLYGVLLSWYSPRVKSRRQGLKAIILTGLCVVAVFFGKDTVGGDWTVYALYLPALAGLCGLALTL